MKSRTFILALILLSAVIIAGCVEQPIGGGDITNFEECIEAGYPAMESYPRQCSDGEQTFTEEIKDAELLCTSTGGSLETTLCCKSASDFPNSCLIGACGCAPGNSHDVKTCTCGEEKCFDNLKGCV